MVYHSFTDKYFQDVDPSRRLGFGLDGYAALKFHPFFKGIDWENLRGSSPPQLAQELDVLLSNILFEIVHHISFRVISLRNSGLSQAANCILLLGYKQ